MNVKGSSSYLSLDRSEIQTYACRRYEAEILSLGSLIASDYHIAPILEFTRFENPKDTFHPLKY
jgi:hypothetical protein